MYVPSAHSRKGAVRPHYHYDYYYYIWVLFGSWDQNLGLNLYVTAQFHF